jgi:hypothetical protein
MQRKDITQATPSDVEGRGVLTLSYWTALDSIELLFGKAETPEIKQEISLNAGLLTECFSVNPDLEFSTIEHGLVNVMKIANNLTDMEYLGCNESMKYYRVTFNLAKKFVS